MNKNKDDQLKTATAIFSDSGYPLPIELRPIWRIGLMCVAIHAIGTDGVSLKLNKMRVILWMLIRPQNWGDYYDSLHLYSNSILSMSSDRSTDKAIELAIAKNFLQLDSEALILGEEGYKLLQLAHDLSLFNSEVEFLLSIKNKVTDKYIKRILGQEKC
tara:strand:+ start:18658 stop:19134 length:477 start_codon:yes stop_codon:yes gene_type:complete